MKLKRANNLLREKQCNQIKIWSQFEVVKVGVKRTKWSTKEELKNHVVQFRMIMRKFCMTMQNGTEEGFMLQAKRDLGYKLRGMCKLILHEHAKISHTHAKWSKKCFNMLLLPLTLEFRKIVQNVNILCTMVILLINSKLLNEEASRKPLRWCQVFTWP